MKKVIILLLFFSISLAVVVYINKNKQAVAQSTDIQSELNQLYKKAEQAISEDQRQKADFYIARYMGKAFLGGNLKDLLPLYKRLDIGPLALLPRSYNEDFVEWFFYGPLLYWKNDQAIWQGEYAFELISADNGDYYVIINGYPFVHGWYTAQGNEEYMVLVTAFIDSQRKPYVLSGKLTNGKSSQEFERLNIDTEEHTIQYFWKPEFHDLDNDGIPEVWIRYNKGWGVGFSQELEIYKIENNKLKLFKKFTGTFEGLARRLENGNIEIAEGFSDKALQDHSSHNKHHFEIYQYKNGEFIKISERDESHILHSEAWKDYYWTDSLKNK
jgi:hypothetical protein